MAHAFIILSPLRSFSSVVCGMLGQHPQLYGMPELNLFVADDLEGWYRYQVQQKRRPQATHGLLRTLAQFHDGEQTEATIQKAWNWIEQRRDWSTARVWDYLTELAQPRILVDKSPITVMQPEFLARARKMLPGAYFLHLTRHPLSTARSIEEYWQQKAEFGFGEQTNVEALAIWYMTHKNIVDFTATLPAGQSALIQGEWLIGEPDRYLPQIAQWLGLRADSAAITAMKHPEASPFARLGPGNARFGNDRKFLTQPALRPTSFKALPEIEGNPALAAMERKGTARALVELANYLGYR
jgi:hypothetical protein